jgi:flagellar biogenesis protein FliO
VSVLSQSSTEHTALVADFASQTVRDKAGPQSWYAGLAPVLRRIAGAMLVYARQGNAALLKKRQRRLRVSETLSLGDKRFVSILEVDGQSFLVGGSGASIALLASLAKEPTSFEGVLRESLQRGEVR